MQKRTQVEAARPLNAFTVETPEKALRMAAGLARRCALLLRERYGRVYGASVLLLVSCGLLLRAMLEHPELQGLRRILLATQDAHRLYAQFGFQPLAHPEHYLTIHHPDVYRSKPVDRGH